MAFEIKKNQESLTEKNKRVMLNNCNCTKPS